jgi:hypothetical protein
MFSDDELNSNDVLDMPVNRNLAIAGGSSWSDSLGWQAASLETAGTCRHAPSRRCQTGTEPAGGIPMDIHM